MDLLIYFAFPIATIIIAIVLQKILNSPILVAATIFAIFLIVTFANYDETFLIATLIYTIIAYIVAFIVKTLTSNGCGNGNVCESNACNDLANMLNNNSDNCACNNLADIINNSSDNNSCSNLNDMLSNNNSNSCGCNRRRRF